MKFPRFLVNHVKDYSSVYKDKNSNYTKVPPSLYNVVFTQEKENTLIMHARVRINENTELMHNEAESCIIFLQQ